MSCDLLENISPNSRLEGTVKVLFSEGDYKSCSGNNTPDSFCDLGSVKGFEIQQESEITDRYKYACGKKEIIDKVPKENGMKLASTILDLTRSNLKSLLRGKDVTAIAQAALTAQAIDSFDFTVTASDSAKIYILNDSSTGTKTPVLNLTSVTIADAGTPLVEGTDFVVQKSFGEVKFLTPQTALLTVTVDATSTNVVPLDFGGANVIKGYMRVLYYPAVDTIGDQCEPEVQIDAVGFITFQDSITFNNEAEAEATMIFDVTGSPRMTDLRNLSA